MEERVQQLEKIQKEGKELFIRKNTDYGDSFADYGPIGVLVRLGDKIKRLQSINKNGITLVSDEKMRDTLIDLHNYSAMAIMLIDEEEVKEYVKHEKEHEEEHEKEYEKEHEDKGKVKETNKFIKRPSKILVN